MSIVQESVQQNDTAPHLSATSVFLYWLFAILCLVPWIIIQSQTAVNSDVAWLSVCAERILAGGSMSQDCYDNNPPLSIIIYMLPVGLSQLLDIPSYHLIFWITFALALAASYACYRFLVILEWADQHEALLYAFAFLASVTIVPALSYAEREQFIAFGMLPFALCQMCITRKKSVSRPMLLSTLILGSVALLIKPFFGLLAVLLFLHRAYLKQKKIETLKIVLDPDFIALSAITAIYFMIIYVLFNDFIFAILPDVYKLYFNYGGTSFVLFKTILLLILLLLNFLIFIGHKKNRPLDFMILLCAGILVCIMSYFVQAKGFSYHLIPTYTLLYLALLLNLNSFIWDHFKVLFIKYYGFLFFYIFVFLCTYAYSPPNKEYPAHTYYSDNIFVAYLDKYCIEPCSYFILNDNMGIVSELAFYNEASYASRFPTFWFSPIVENQIKNPIDMQMKSKAIELRKRFSEMIALDFERHNPSVLLFLIYDGVQEEYPMASFLDSERYTNFILKYHKVDTFSVDRAQFYPKTKYDFRYIQTWDVYVKKDTPISSP